MRQQEKVKRLENKRAAGISSAAFFAPEEPKNQGMREQKELTKKYK